MTESVALPPKPTALLGSDVEMSEDWYAFFGEMANVTGASGAAFPQYEAVQRSPLSMLAGSPAPTTSSLTASTTAYLFENTTSRYLLTSFEIPRGADPGQNAYPYFIFATDDDSAGTVAWTVDYTISAAGSVNTTESNIEIAYALPGSGRAAGKTYRAVGSANISDSELFPGESLPKSAVITAQLGRDAAGASDTYAAGVLLLSAGVLYQRSLPGSVDP